MVGVTGMEELKPLSFRLRYYPAVLVSLVALIAVGASLPYPEPLLQEVYTRYLERVKELRNLLINATTREKVVYQFFFDSVSSVLASATPVIGPFFTAYTLTSVGVGVRAIAVAESRAPFYLLLTTLLDPSVWILLLAYTVAVVESAYLTQVIMRRNRLWFELTFAMLALAATLALLSATLTVVLAAL